jgi:hypothetical protein
MHPGTTEDCLPDFLPAPRVGIIGSAHNGCWCASLRRHHHLPLTRLLASLFPTVGAVSFQKREEEMASVYSAHRRYTLHLRRNTTTSSVLSEQEAV